MENLRMSEKGLEGATVPVESVEVPVIVVEDAGEFMQVRMFGDAVKVFQGIAACVANFAEKTGNSIDVVIHDVERAAKAMTKHEAN